MHVSRLRPVLCLLTSFALGVLACADESKPAPAAEPSALAAPASDTPAAPAGPTVESSVVKIFSTVRAPDLSKPWTKSSPRETSGSGVVIEGNRILTNAHVVLYASQVQVQGHQSGEKIPATVEAIAPGIDLAVLKVDDESFFATRPALARAKRLPSVKDPVMAYGYPTGGSGLSITKGIVSRIDFASYSFPTSGLRIQIDAAINPGNSGGPALSGEQMIGLSFSRLGGGDNIGYIIPNEEIELFLADVADGKYDGKPALFDNLQVTQNPTLRTFAKIPKGSTGILVTEPDAVKKNNPLQRWDVITRIGDKSVDDEGMVKIGENQRVFFTYQLQHSVADGRIALQVLREGKAVDLSVPVVNRREMLLASLNGDYPTYFIYGPLVFTAVTSETLGFSNSSAGQLLSVLGRMGSPLVTRRHEHPAFDGEQLVMISSPLFSHKIARGYSNPTFQVVDTVNGTKIKNLAHLVSTLRDLKDAFAIFRFAGEGLDAIVLPRAEVAAATEEILTDNGIRAQASPALQAIWTEAAK